MLIVSKIEKNFEESRFYLIKPVDLKKNSDLICIAGLIVCGEIVAITGTYDEALMMMQERLQA
jgi:hypothetical protein